MKGVDLFILTPTVAFEDEEERRKHRQRTLRDITSRFHAMSKAARTKGEEAMKLKAMRKLRFGDYIARVPERNITRHLDYPLPESHASTHAIPPLQGWEERKIVPGQKLHGCMIQRRKCTDNSDESHTAEVLLRRLLAGEVMTSEANRISAPRKCESIDEIEEQGIEIKLCEAVARRRRKKRLQKIPEDGEENSSHSNGDGDDETVVSFMLIPSHITMPANCSDDTSITSSLGPETSKYYDDLLEEESVEVVALFKDHSEKDKIGDSETVYFDLAQGT